MYTATPGITDRVLGDFVYMKDGYEVYSFQGRFFLYRKSCQIATLISGQTTLDKKFKGDFDKWIQSVKDKDIQKIENIKAHIEELKKDIETIKDIHSIQ